MNPRIRAIASEIERRDKRHLQQQRAVHVIAGALRSNVESLARIIPDSYNVRRLEQLCDELDAALNLKAYSDWR